MHIAELTAHVVQVRLRREIQHASATRQDSTNLVVRCRLDDGITGWGEGVPRDYVTGETPQDALRQFAATDVKKLFDSDCAKWSDVVRLCESFQPLSDRRDARGAYGNALRCAVELSLLDAYGRQFGEPVHAVAQHFPPAQSWIRDPSRVRYSTTITAETALRERISAVKMRLYGFCQCKVKVGVPGADDCRRLRRIRFWLGRRVDLRLDANEAWAADELPFRVKPLLRFRISCIEQPVPHREVGRLPAMRRQLGVPVMLDESLTSMADAEQAIGLGACDLFNIRLSKCGGFLNSLRLAARAREAAIGYQLGCHPGETGILSAAGRHWASIVPDIRYLEGSYDRHLLKELLTLEDITFGYGGRAPALGGPGLGVTVNEAVLERWTTDRFTHRFK